ncbi:MAG: ABC transporter substrate-binding protein [bacterium]
MGLLGLVILLELSVLSTSGAAASPGTSDPKATVETLLSLVASLSKGNESDPNPTLTRKISETIDIVGVCRTCLQNKWEEIGEAEQKNFVALFRQVLEEVAYPKSAKFFKDAQIEIGQVKQNGADQAEVFTTVTDPDEGMVDVDYSLKLQGPSWLMEDVILDGVSLVTDLRSQMQKILREHSYEELKRRLREKLV